MKKAAKRSSPKKRATTTRVSTGAIRKTPTHIPGFDYVAEGGIPTGRATLVAGSAGSGKTVFAAQFLSMGILEDDEPGVFVTFEEPPADLRRNVKAFGWDIEGWEKQGKWRFVDVSPDAHGPTPIVGQFDLGGLMARVTNAVEKTKAKRVALDTLSALIHAIPDPALLRTELFKIVAQLKEMGVTVLITAERPDDLGPITRNGVEEFVADNVIILRNSLADERRRRTVEILKFRGTAHKREEVTFTITQCGIVVLPLTSQELTQASTTLRIPSGISELDEMAGGGFFRDSVILISGATGTGKTLAVTQFMSGGLAGKDRCLLFAFEESRDQLIRNAEAWGMDYVKAEKTGRLKIVSQYPHSRSMEDHFVVMRDMINEYKPDRVAVDSLSALERVFNLRSFREFVISITALLKQKSITGVFTSTTATLLGGGSVTERHISTLTDSIILLRYVERDGRMARGLTILKMRGSLHDTSIREYTIDKKGMHIGPRFRGMSGILSGAMVPTTRRRGEDSGYSAEKQSEEWHDSWQTTEDMSSDE
ncbi:MAG TPA: circadian clock protein KaiC [Gemmatimonadaceae bacterium]|nr:circadian clock protein KaiC [Gemmatimonadaceae bacterium]